VKGYETDVIIIAEVYVTKYSSNSKSCCLLVHFISGLTVGGIFVIMQTLSKQTANAISI
jgi:protein tyrosine phosphatase